MSHALSLFLAFALFADARSVAPCAFCSPSASFPSLQRHLEQNDDVILAETVAPGELSIRAVLKSSGGYAKEQVIHVDRLSESNAGGAWLVLLRASGGEPGAFAVTPDAARFAEAFAELPPVEVEDASAQVARLAFFLSEIGNRDKLVAATVGHAFAEAPYTLVKRLRPHLDASKLSAWIEEAPPEHRGILYLLLAVEGSSLAKDTLEAHLDDATARTRAGYDGLLGGFLLLFGKPGLEQVLAARPPVTADSAQRVWYSRCLLRALDFHLTSENVLEQGDVIAAIHGLFDDPYAAGPAIGLLIAHEHWASLDRVLALRETWATERPSIDRATKAFLRACTLPRAKKLWAEIETSRPPGE